MPELPEVHTTATMLNTKIRNHSILDVWTDYNSSYHLGKKNIKDQKYFKQFKKQIQGKKILGVRRRAKNVLIDLSSNTTILIHMKMTGHILYGKYRKVSKKSKASSVKKGNKETWVPEQDGPLQDPFNQFIHLVFTLDNGMHFVLSDVRKFAKIMYFETSATPLDLQNIGPEPMDNKFKNSDFIERLLTRPNKQIKEVLLDQSVIAGVGNIYSDESLWYAGIHPKSLVSEIPKVKLNKLFSELKKVFSKSIKTGGDSMSDYRNPDGIKGNFQNLHKAYRKTGAPCSKTSCTGNITRIVVAGRGTHHCNKHQLLFT